MLFKRTGHTVTLGVFSSASTAKLQGELLLDTICDERPSREDSQTQSAVANSLRIRVPLETANESTVDALHTLCARQKGAAKCVGLTWNARAIHGRDGGGRLYVMPDRNFIAGRELCGRGAVRVID